MGRDAAGDLWAGNARMAARMGAELDGRLDAMQAGDQTMVLLGRGARLLGAVTVADATARHGPPGGGGAAPHKGLRGW